MNRHSPTDRSALLPVVTGGRFGLFIDLAAGALLWGALATSLSQTTEVAIIKNFKIPDYYPHTQQLKTLLVGAEAQFQLNQPIPIKGLLIETYASDGHTNLIIRAPDCVYDNRSQTASSPGRLELQSADGRFRLEGDGFLWRQTNASLIVSNRVRTVIYGDLFKTQTLKR